MRTIHYLIFSLTLLLSPLLWAESDYRPTAVLKLDPLFSHHVLVAEKSTHTLYLFESDNGRPKLLKKFQMATGKKAGNKFFQGDFRTPEGVYTFTQFIPYDDLIKMYGKEGEIYGVGAFVMNYPNPIDSFQQKTGGGIWLHSTNDETRIDKGLDSRGCIVTANTDLKEISTYLELNRTSVVVVQNLHYLPASSWERESKELQDMVENWRQAWESEDLKGYLSHYHPKEFVDSVRGDYNSFASYKKAVFSNPGQPEVQLGDLSILRGDTYAVATFTQNYRSNTINDVGKKLLYLKRDEYYQWKIVSEIWTKAGITETGRQVAFEPSMRFFKSEEAKTNN